MFCLALLPDKPELRNFQDSKIWSKVHVYGMFIFFCVMMLLPKTFHLTFVVGVKILFCYSLALGPAIDLGSCLSSNLVFFGDVGGSWLGFDILI